MGRATAFAQEMDAYSRGIVTDPSRLQEVCRDLVHANVSDLLKMWEGFVAKSKEKFAKNYPDSTAMDEFYEILRQRGGINVKQAEAFVDSLQKEGTSQDILDLCTTYIDVMVWNQIWQVKA